MTILIDRVVGGEAWCGSHISKFETFFDMPLALKAISFKNELEKSFPQKFADNCSQQKFVYLIRATILKAI